MKLIVLFDGVCNFFNQNVQFMIKKDPSQSFQFASLQSEMGEKIKTAIAIPEQIDSLILIEKERYFTKSTAALKIARHLKGPTRLLYVFIAIPKPIRDFFYQILAKNRYKWFGKRDSCMIPTPKERQRFLD